MNRFNGRDGNGYQPLPSSKKNLPPPSSKKNLPPKWFAFIILIIPMVFAWGLFCLLGG